MECKEVYAYWKRLVPILAGVVPAHEYRCKGFGHRAWLSLEAVRCLFFTRYHAAECSMQARKDGYVYDAGFRHFVGRYTFRRLLFWSQKNVY